MRPRSLFALMLVVGPVGYLACGDDEAANPNAPRSDATAEGAASDGAGGGDAASDGSTASARVLDLDALTGLTGLDEVTTWLDSSGRDNTAAAVAGPLPVEPGIYGKRAVRFDGTKHLQVADSDSLHLGEDDFLIAAVLTYEQADTASSHVVFAKQLAADPFTGPALMANHAFRPGEATDRSITIAGVIKDGPKGASFAARAVPPPSDNVPHLVTIQRNKTALVIRVDRQQRGQSILPPSLEASAAGAAMLIGGDGQAGHGLKGYIGQIVVYRGTVPDRTRGDIENGLTNKWLRPPPVTDAGDAGDADGD